ncbi:MAG TPA: glycosyltransferase, partial [Hyphomicrobiales bacterium]|nr:glycosyltransferase [Hyphomicrobiales bacterium]
NFTLLIDTVARLKGSLDVTLDIFGEGGERQRLAAQIDRLGLGETVHLRGSAARWFAREEVVGADIFVNLSDTEGFCITVAEAMAAGLPVIATDVGGIRDYGLDGGNMLKLAAPEGAALEAALMGLADDEALRRRLGESARANMMSEYGPRSLRRRAREALAGGS